MRKGKSVIGKKILSLEDGVELETVQGILVDPEGRDLMALVVSEGGFMSTSKVVPFANVASFGRDAVVIDNAGAVVDANADPALAVPTDDHDKIIGKAVYTTTGDRQGEIADIYFDESSGKVVGYEISGGVLGDVAKGRSYLATDEITTIGEDLIYVEPETAETLESQVGGIQGSLQGAGEKLGKARETASSKLGDAGSKARDRAGDLQPEQRLVGRRAGSDVESDEGSVIVPKGRRIRPEDVEAAKSAGKLPALTAAVARGDAQEAGADAKDALEAAGDKAGSLWDQFTAKIAEVTDATGRRMDAAQTKQRLDAIADAIGRPVTKVILDRQDNVVLNMGDIITHQAVQRAHESGGLDSLLDSVYKGNVELTKDELRAPGTVQAEATVDKAEGGATVVDELESKVEAAEREKAAEEQRKRSQSATERDARARERDAKAREREAKAAAGTSADAEADAETGADEADPASQLVPVGPGRSVQDADAGRTTVASGSRAGSSR